MSFRVYCRCNEITSCISHNFVFHKSTRSGLERMIKCVHSIDVLFRLTSADCANHLISFSVFMWHCRIHLGTLCQSLAYHILKVSRAYIMQKLLVKKKELFLFSFLNIVNIYWCLCELVHTFSFQKWTGIYTELI